MSGPKCSQVRLMEREKRRLKAVRQQQLAEELRLIKEDKCRELDLKITTARARLDAIKTDIIEKNAEVITKAKGLLKTNFDLENAENLIFKKELAGFYAMVDPYLTNPFLDKNEGINNLIKAVNSIAQNEKIDLQYKSSQLSIRKKMFVSMKTGYDKEIKHNKHLFSEFKKVLDNYNALCSIAGEKANSYPFGSETAVKSIEELNCEVERLQKLAEEKAQTDYIIQSIDEVMKDLGYDVIATDHLTTPQKESTHHIYEFEQGNVINVYTSDNGSLMFEVSGVKEDDNPMTDLEKLKVKESMESFCGKYPEIKGMLIERGIGMNNEELKPPDVRYARAINIHKKNIISSRKKEDLSHRPREKKKACVMRNGE